MRLRLLVLTIITMLRGLRRELKMVRVAVVGSSKWHLLSSRRNLCLLSRKILQRRDDGREDMEAVWLH
jgi:hypothetical protein